MTTRPPLFAGAGNDVVAIQAHDTASAYIAAVDREPEDDDTCSLCQRYFGGGSWETRYTVQVMPGPGVGDAMPSEFCEDCMNWLQSVAPAITLHASIPAGRPRTGGEA